MQLKEPRLEIATLTTLKKICTTTDLPQFFCHCFISSTLGYGEIMGHITS